MTAAIELRRAGFAVRIIDKSDHMAQHSQALVVQARTLDSFSVTALPTKLSRKEGSSRTQSSIATVS